jgi:hypothetical protein
VSEWTHFTVHRVPQLLYLGAVFGAKSSTDRPKSLEFAVCGTQTLSALH